MWWRDQDFGGFRRVGAALVLGLGLTLGACADLHPMYGSVNGGPATSERLKSVDIAGIDSRISQKVRNEMVFAFYGGGEQAPPQYQLTMRVADSSVPVGIERFADLPAAYLVQLSATFSLVELSTGRTVHTGTSFANASYDFSTQRFANVRAQRDAENRAANVIAGDISTKIAGYFATHP